MYVCVCTCVSVYIVCVCVHVCVCVCVHVCVCMCMETCLCGVCSGGGRGGGCHFFLYIVCVCGLCMLVHSLQRAVRALGALCVLHTVCVCLWYAVGTLFGFLGRGGHVRSLPPSLILCIK